MVVVLLKNDAYNFFPLHWSAPPTTKLLFFAPLFFASAHFFCIAKKGCKKMDKVQAFFLLCSFFCIAKKKVSKKRSGAKNRLQRSGTKQFLSGNNYFFTRWGWSWQMYFSFISFSSLFVKKKRKKFFFYTATGTAFFFCKKKKQ